MRHDVSMPDRLSDVILCIANGVELGHQNVSASRWDVNAWIPPNGADQFSQFNGNGAVYKDNVQSFSTVEPAIDLTASSFLAFSWVIAGAPSGMP